DLVYYIPNAFTPDGDGLNDVFKPVFSHIDESSYHIRIFDRWGRVVFESDDADEGWRGDQRGDGHRVRWNVYNFVIRVKPLYSTEAQVIKVIVTRLRQCCLARATRGLEIRVGYSGDGRAREYCGFSLVICRRAIAPQPSRKPCI